jgi:hypothetical protein
MRPRRHTPQSAHRARAERRHLDVIRPPLDAEHSRIVA